MAIVKEMTGRNRAAHLEIVKQDVPRTVGERARARPWEEQGTEGNSLSSSFKGILSAKQKGPICVRNYHQSDL